MSEVPDLETRPRDRAIALAKSVSSAIPGFGSLVAEIILEDIPGQRLDRIADFVKLLHERVSVVELEHRRSEPEAIDLFEEGAYQSTRATTVARRERIAAVVANGLRGDDAARIEAKRLLQIMQDLDDDQFVILSALLLNNLNDEDFHERHKRVLEPVYPGSSQAEQDRATAFELARARLMQLGLTRNRYKRVTRNGQPEFDDTTGMMKAAGKELTDLGRLLLRRTGLAADDEF